ncbi:MAG: ABC transporter ATP-binding protein [Deltaproteobacteria bacterium]|nr:ABC transporter ATP-binding protein [Deltaproteobacteria bacterium]
MLRIEKLHHYYGGSHTLNDVSLEVAAGTCTAVLGRNGVGKSTLLKAIMGVERVRSGTINFDGRNITNASSYSRARLGLGYVPQGREIFPRLTVEENLLTGLAGQKSRSIDADIYEMFPVLKEMAKRRGGDLSGGQQQQLAIGRALLTKPKLLILDEPTEGIQPSVISQIQKVLHRVKSGQRESPEIAAVKSAVRRIKSEGRIAILLVEQYFDFAREICDAYCVLDRGAVVHAGGRDDLSGDAVRKMLAV